MPWLELEYFIVAMLQRAWTKLRELTESVCALFCSRLVPKRLCLSIKLRHYNYNDFADRYLLGAAANTVV